MAANAQLVLLEGLVFPVDVDLKEDLGQGASVDSVSLDDGENEDPAANLVNPEWAVQDDPEIQENQEEMDNLANQAVQVNNEMVYTQFNINFYCIIHA